MISKNYLEELQDIKELPEKGVLLDLGCGNGRFSVPFSKAGWKCVLVDSDRSILSSALYNVEGVFEAHNSDLNDFLAKDERKYDIIIANNVLPFLGSKHDMALDAIYSKLKKGGVLIGVFFGNKDPWKSNKNMVFHSKNEAVADLKRYEILNFSEVDAKLGMLNGGIKRWHRFEFVVRKM